MGEWVSDCSPLSHISQEIWKHCLGLGVTSHGNNEWRSGLINADFSVYFAGCHVVFGYSHSSLCVNGSEALEGYLKSCFSHFFCSFFLSYTHPTSTPTQTSMSLLHHHHYNFFLSFFFFFYILSFNIIGINTSLYETFFLHTYIYII